MAFAFNGGVYQIKSSFAGSASFSTAISRSFRIAAAALTFFILAGCVPNANVPPAGTPPQLQGNSTTSANANIAEPSNANLSSVPVTLPMLDAMLADEKLVGDLRSKAQLNDEQIQKLRDAARNAVLQLSENDDDAGRSTAAATRAALAKIKELVGAEKADSVVSIVRNYWSSSGGDISNLSAEPNAIPADTRIVVNAPAFRMDIFKNGVLTKTYKVGIGYPEFPLPSGLRKADEIIFNPTWTPPDEPWVKGKFAPGKKVNAGSADNPLGVIKIPIGLPSLIHGGKAPSRLGTFASHGCIGLTNGQIQNFAMEISAIAGQPLDATQIKSFEKNKTSTESVKLAQALPVELRYETIVATDDGKLTIYRDVYERGTNNEQNLRRVLDAVGVPFGSLSPELQNSLRAALQKMAVDATGDPVSTDAGENSNRRVEGKSADVTRNIKGEKQISFDIPSLKGKGYPVPVNLQSS